MKERMSWSQIICLRHSFRDWSRKVNEQGGKRKEIKEREIIIYKQKKRCFDHSFFLSDSLALNLPNLSLKFFDPLLYFFLRVPSLWTYIWNYEYLRSEPIFQTTSTFASHRSVVVSFPHSKLKATNRTKKQLLPSQSVPAFRRSARPSFEESKKNDKKPNFHRYLV